MAQDRFGPFCLREYTPRQLDVIKGIQVSFPIRNFLRGTTMTVGTYEMNWGDGTTDFPNATLTLPEGHSRTLTHAYTRSGSYTIRFEWIGGFQTNQDRVWRRPDGEPGTCNHEIIIIPINVREPSPPVADAGAPRPFFVDLLAGGLKEDVVLDGTRSSHPDGTPITYQWAVIGGPCAGSLPWQAAHFNSRSAIVLRAGTPISKPCLGTYTFRLTVQDSGGRISFQDVFHTLAEVNHAPEANAGSPRVWQLGRGYKLQEDVVLDGSRSRDPDGDPLSYGWQVIDGLCKASLPWETGTFTQASAIALRAQTRMLSSCFGQYLFRLTVTDGKGGVSSSEVQHRFEIVAPTLRILQNAPSVVEYLKLGREGVKLHVQEAAAPDAVQPDAYELRVDDVRGLLGTIPVAAVQIAQGVLWKGETIPGRETRPGHQLGLGVYKLSVVALTGGYQLAQSNEHQIQVVDIIVDLVGVVTVREQDRPWQTQQQAQGPFRREEGEKNDPGVDNSLGRDPRPVPVGVGPATDAGRGQALPSLSISELFATRAFVISASGPEMPQITVKATAKGFPPGHQPLWEMRLEVVYQNDVRNDIVKAPSTVDWERLASGGSEWEMVPSEFCGGRVTGFCRTTIGGEELIGRSFGDFWIWGENPTKARVRAEFGLLSFQVVGYLESRFTQFSNEVDLPQIEAHRKEPASVLRRGARYGIGGLAKPVSPKQLWNWRENVKETTKRLTSYRADAAAYQMQVQNGEPWDKRTGGEPPGQGKKYSDAPPFTQDQLDLEMWSRYAGGLRYHDYLPGVRTWLRRTDLRPDGGASLAFAENALFVRDSVRDELFPSGWHDEEIFQGARSSVPLTVIRELRKDPRASEALDYLVAAGWTVQLREYTLTVAQPFRVDFDRRELLINDLSVSDELRASWLVGAIRQAFRSSKELRLRSELAAAFQIFVRTDLKALEKAAMLYQWSLWHHASDAQALLDDMMYILTEYEPHGLSNNGGVYRVWRLTNPRTNEELIIEEWNSGFRRELRDNGNQVRHMTVSLQASYWLGQAGLQFMQYREESPGSADTRLNQRCYDVAQGLKSGGSTWQVTDIEQIMLREFGDPLQTAPWTGPPDGDPDG